MWRPTWWQGIVVMLMIAVALIGAFAPGALTAIARDTWGLMH